MQKTNVTDKQPAGAPTAAAEDLTLNDWMAQIREKKLRKIVPNGHKQAATPGGAANGAGEDTLLNEIQRRRQGLRAVSASVGRPAPGSRGASSSGDKSALTGFEAPKLRTVSSPSRAPMTNGTAATMNPIERETASETVKDAASQADAAQKTKEEVAEAASEEGDDEPFPLDAEPTAELQSVTTKASPSKDAEKVPLTPSAGVTADPTKPVELTLPSAKHVPAEDDDFPLDTETAAQSKPTELAELAEEVPLTPSAGVTAVLTKPVELTLPSAKHVPADEDDFPLDAETAAQADTTNNSKDLEAVEEPITPSVGVFAASDRKLELTLPRAKHVPQDDDDFPLDSEQKTEEANSKLIPAAAEDEPQIAPTGDSDKAVQPVKLTLPVGKQARKTVSLAPVQAEAQPDDKAEAQVTQVHGKNETADGQKNKTADTPTVTVDSSKRSASQSPTRGKISSKQRTELSRLLSRILRHKATDEGLVVRPDGFISVTALLQRPKLKKLKATLPKVEEVVAMDNKSRFALKEIDGIWHIRANQGHSIQVDDLELQRIEDAASVPKVLHGTYAPALQLIKKSGGLSKMRRNHIHLATGKFGEAGVTSGVRKDCTVFIYIDLAKAMADGITFFKSANGVVLTEGVDGVLAEKYFTKIEELGEAAEEASALAIASAPEAKDKKDF